MRSRPIDGAQIIDGAVAGDGEEPRADGSFAGFEALHAIPDPEERFLHEVLGDPGVAHHTQDERKDQAAVAIVEFREGLRVAALEAQNQVAIAFGDAQGQQ